MFISYRLCIIAMLITVCAQTSSAQSVTILKGAGATFPYPIYAKWFDSYSGQNSNVKFTYEGIGSTAGVRKLLDGTVDFGASDSPEILGELASVEEKNYLLLPSVIGAVVPIINLPGVAKEVCLTPEALAGIYLGNIKKWSDPILQKANHGAHLPDIDIVVVHRADGSGTSYTWTDFLSQTSPDWKAQVGVGLDPKWPVGRSAKGNEGVAQIVKELGGSIGYVEFIYALKDHLSFAKVQNKHGEFVTADLESITASAATAMADATDFKMSIVNASAAGAYPIASFTWLIVPLHIADESKRTALIAFLKWMLSSGQRQSAALGYAALPSEIVSRELKALDGIR